MSRPHARMHHVSVAATKAPNGETVFQPASEVWNDSDNSLHFHKDRHGMRKADYHLVEFVLDDRTGDGLKFPSVPHDAMWVAEVEDSQHPSCPDKDTKSDYDVLEPICVCDEGRRLVVRNDNPRAQTWSFTLNFVKSSSDESDKASYVSWDPITQNHNGGT